MNRRFLEESILRRSALFKAMAEFNRSIFRELPHARKFTALGACGKALLQDRAVIRALHSQAEGEPHKSWWDFTEESTRLILLAPGELQNLALRFSAAVHAEEIARVIDGKHILQLRRELGEDILNYAVRRGRYQIGSVRMLLLPHTRGGSLSERIPLLAAAVLMHMAAAWPEELKKLWREKLSSLNMLPAAGIGTEDANGENTASDAKDIFFLPEFDREQKRLLWFTFKKILLREAAPQWAQCFE